MGFLNPFLLVGLGAAGIPVLIHLWSRRRARTMDFSTLRFLREAHRRTVRRFQLEHWLILALRVLALVCLTLALARPILHRRGLFARGHVRTAAVIVLDNSASMGFEGVRGSVFQQAKERALQVLRSLQAGDEAGLVLMSDTARALFEPPTTQLPDVRRAVEAAPITARGTSVEPALQLAVGILRRSAAPNRELYVVSDFARNGWASARVDATGVRLFLVPVGDDERPNAAITALQPVNPLVAANIPATFAVAVRSTGSTTTVERVLEFRVDGETRRSLRVTLPPQAEVTERFPHTFDRPGIHHVSAVLDSDRFPADDERRLALPVVGQVRAVVAGPNTLHLGLALSPQVPHSSAAVRVVASGPTALRDTSLQDADALLLQDPDFADPRLLTRVEAFVQNGGTCVVFLGGRATRNAARDVQWLPAVPRGLEVFSRPAKLLPVHLAPLPDGAVGGGGPRRHAESVFGVYPRDAWQRPTAPNFYRAHRLDVRNDAEALALFTGGVPAVLAANVQRGKVVVVNTPAAGAEWANLPLSPYFVPLVQQLLFYGLEREWTPRRDLEAGEPYIRALQPTDPIALIVATPAGEQKTVSSADGARVVFSETGALGVYAVTAPDGGSRKRFEDGFAVNLPRAESELDMVSPEDVRAQARGAVEVAGEPAPGRHFDAMLQERRVGRELSGLFLAAALVLLAVETVVSNRNGQQTEVAPRAADAGSA
jgi:hypothetical protein